ncbi:undecaprenyl/decaprenyl-phosphate alpha-N-acetylglucosaminyl 1-phosphate transferase [Candidatus Daviesbacteria bacterium]|nr:undecaprenyl/decaprenyl-phosphate alpha-N-acetylglucosaminyl 1-phosphate transferase [Candidatus Daviesbacteria bacterium]
MDYILITLTAFVITLLATPITINLAKKFGLVDNPKLRPHPAHVQNRIVPRAGGVPIFSGLLIASLIFLPLDKHLTGILAGALILLIIGLIDDKKPNFNPYLRLILLFGAAGVAVASGIGISFIANPLANFNLPILGSSQFIQLDQIIIPFNILGPHRIILLADIFAFIWIVVLMQIINWSKGVDGQMPGITSVAALTLAFLSLKLYFNGDINQLNVARLAFISAGVSLGFLVFNWYPAKIFPGFSGSTILAFMLATLSILSGAKVATALLVLGVPAADFIYTFFRRIAQGHSPVWGDRAHLHHRLLDLGWSHRKISLFYIFGSAILGSVALLSNTESKFFVGIIVLLAFLGFIKKYG